MDKRLELLIVYYMENIETAILLMVVGMATVFVILLIVIYLGKLLITLVNKYAPEAARSLQASFHYQKQCRRHQ